MTPGVRMDDWRRQKVRIEESSPSHDQHLVVGPSRWPLEGRLRIEMRNANAGSQNIRLDREDVSDLVAWLLAWQEQL